MKPVLFVDDEPNILQAIERHLRKEFPVTTAVGPRLGLKTLAEGGPFSVVVSDLRMPEMDGIAFLARVRAMSPETVRIILTGQADLEGAIAAVNNGKIFQFLTKPCSPDILKRVLFTAQEQYRLVTAERELLEQTLRCSIGVLTEIMSLVNPDAFGRALRIRRYVVHIAKRLDLEDRWQFEVAAMLSEIGSVTVPPELMEKHYRGEPLTQAEAQIITGQSHIGAELLARIPRLEMIARMVEKQHSQASVCGPAADPVSTGAQLIQVAHEFDGMMLRGTEPSQAIAVMQSRCVYRPEFLAALRQIHLEESRRARLELSVDMLRTGMIIHKDVHARNGLLLLGKGQEVTESAIARLRNFSRAVGVQEPIVVVGQATVAEEEVPSGPKQAFSLGASLPIHPIS